MDDTRGFDRIHVKVLRALVFRLQHLGEDFAQTSLDTLTLTDPTHQGK